jgi:hypothetical protein
MLDKLRTIDLLMSLSYYTLFSCLTSYTLPLMINDVDTSLLMYILLFNILHSRDRSIDHFLPSILLLSKDLPRRTELRGLYPLRRVNATPD